jgi:alpha-tubulin suppressor-like RCC1 family protein
MPLGALIACLAIALQTSLVAAHDPSSPTQVPATPEPDRQVSTATLTETAERVLVYGPTAGGLADTTPGIDLTVWDEVTWASKTTADFAAFDAIVFGDQPICFEDPGRWSTAVANHQVWSSAVTGNMIINGTDPDFHGKSQLVHQSVQFAGSDPAAGPGLYVSLSCGYQTATGFPTPLLAGFGDFVVRGLTNCPNDAHKVAEHPTLTGIDDAYLSNWRCSTHEVFDSWPSDFQPLAIIQDGAPNGTGNVYTAADGQSGYVYMLASGVSETCGITNDADGDCLSTDTEAAIGTLDTDADTDDDGLLDPWEVGSGIPGNGFHLTGRPTISRDAVFGPYGTGDIRQCAAQIPADRRVPPDFACLNREPDPLHKDVFVELDWLDCSIGNSCAEFFGNQDPLHHAPSIAGLADVVQKFAAAPVSNPDTRTGIALHVLVDEALPHLPNCDQNLAAVRDSHFGTVGQDAIAREAKALAVRYAWSGHSSAKNDDASCPTPSVFEFGTQGYGWMALPDYDHTPFGDANQGGRDILITLGPSWACPGSALLPGEDPFLAGRCFRKTLPPTLCLQCILPPPPTVIPGIFPARISDPGGDLTRNQPIHRLMGETEAGSLRQLWSRSFMHLLGHSLGLGEAAVGNQPAPGSRPHRADHLPLDPLLPDGYADWSSLVLAPSGDGLDIADAFENYDELGTRDLIASDADADAVLEADDNCPGVFNPGQNDLDGRQVDGIVFEFGDACDDDADGDGLADGLLAGMQSQAASAAPSVTESSDPFPFDTDNDGTPNASDTDDDEDGVPDAVDICPLVHDPQQVDTDGDGAGDGCDIDADGDGLDNSTEASFGSDNLDPASRVEFVGHQSSCGNGVDDDGDGAIDASDPDCVDGDGDTAPDARDNCPSVSNSSQLDVDGDGTGDACELTVRILAGTAQTLGPGYTGTQVYWSASASGQFSVRLRGSDCATGLQIDSGTYDAGAYDPSLGELPQPALSIVRASDLIEGQNAIRVCITSGGTTASAAGVVTVDTTAPSPPSIALDPSTDSGSSASDRVTSEDPGLSGQGEANALIRVLRDGTAVGDTVADAAGSWAVVDGSVPEGQHAYVAVAVDPTGNASADSATLSVTVDRTRPVSAASPLPSQVTTPTVDVAFTASDDASGVASVELWSRYRPTSTDPWGAWTLGPTGTTSPITYTVGATGFYEFYTIGTDVAGNREAAPASADAATQKVSAATRTGQAWGNNSQGQLGNGTTANSTTPVDVSNLSGITALGAGAEHSLAVKSDGTAWAWGQNANGELGDGTTTDRLMPVQVSNLTGATAVACGTAHSLVLKSDGTVWSFGLNQNGQLGDGTTTQRTSPVQVSGLTGVIAIAAGSDHSLALKGDGTVWAWGKNTNGQLGDGSKTKRTTPVRSGTLTGVIAIAAGGDHSLALKSDATVWAWGYNFYGELGDGTKTNRTSPVRVTGLTGVVGIAAGSNHSLAVKSDGTVWAWGNNGVGQLGDGTTTSRTTAVRSGTLSGVTKLAAGAHHSLALKSDGTLWAWGYNLYGQIGDGTTTNRTSAVRVTGLSGIATMAGGAFFSLAATGGS